MIIDDKHSILDSKKNSREKISDYSYLLDESLEGHIHSRIQLKLFITFLS